MWEFWFDIGMLSKESLKENPHSGVETIFYFVRASENKGRAYLL